MQRRLHHVGRVTCTRSGALASPRREGDMHAQRRISLWEVFAVRAMMALCWDEREGRFTIIASTSMHPCMHTCMHEYMHAWFC
eukprot:331392-Chlamydomonas_euryale.AAC.7